MGSFALDPNERAKRLHDGLSTLSDQTKSSANDVITDEDIELYLDIQHSLSSSVIAFELMIQFIERCIEDKKDPTLFRNAVSYIACGCSMDGKSNAPASDGARMHMR
jgi:hypothetical protein